MTLEIQENIMRVIILEIGGLYSSIYDEVYCTGEEFELLQFKYCNKRKWRIVVVA